MFSGELSQSAFTPADFKAGASIVHFLAGTFQRQGQGQVFSTGTVDHLKFYESGSVCKTNYGSLVLAQETLKCKCFLSLVGNIKIQPEASNTL